MKHGVHRQTKIELEKRVAGQPKSKVSERGKYILGFYTNLWDNRRDADYQLSSSFRSQRAKESVKIAKKFFEKPA